MHLLLQGREGQVAAHQQGFPEPLLGQALPGSWGTKQQADPPPASLGLFWWVVKVEEGHGLVRGGRSLGASHRPGLAPAVPHPGCGPWRGYKEVTVFRGVVGTQPPGAIRKSPIPTPAPPASLGTFCLSFFIFS